MKLFELDDGYNVVFEPQALSLRPFAALFKRDRSKKKERAIRELSFVYFYADVKSDYQFHTDLEIRKESIKADLQLSKSWEIDKLVGEAIDFYKKMSTSITSEILNDSRYTAKTLSNKMKEAVGDEDLSVDDMSKLLTSLSKIPVVVKALQTAEEAVLKEIAQAKGQIGSKEKALFEDGI